MPRHLADEGAICVDRYDRRIWNRITDESERIQTTDSEQPYTGLLRDVWASLYKASPQINELGSVVNRKIMHNLMNQTAWKDLRHMTQMDEYSAALGSLSLQDTLGQVLPPDIQEQARHVQDLEQQMQQLLDQANAYEQAPDAADALSDSDSLSDSLNQAVDPAESIRQQAAELGKVFEQAAQAFETAFDSHSGSIGRSLRQALEGAVQESQDTQRMMQAWGVGAGDGRPVSGKERLELAQTLTANPKLREIAKMAGRMQTMALHKRRNRTVHPPSEVVNITIGDDLAHILPSELLLLAEPDTEDEFLRRFSEKRLLQYDLRGFEREGQGPIIVCIDESGSTAGQVEMWEKAIALTLFAIARREKRAFAVVHFGSESEIVVRSWQRPKDATSAELIEMAEHFFNGGTNFERPLREAVQIMNEVAFKKGDIVFITDGESRLSDTFLAGEFLRVKKEKGFQVVSVVIGHGDCAVRPFSDHVVRPQMVGDLVLDFVVESLQ